MSSQTLLGAIGRGFFKLGRIDLRDGRPEIAARLQHDWPAFSMLPERMRSQNPALPARGHQPAPTTGQHLPWIAVVAMLLSACSHAARAPTASTAVVSAPRSQQARTATDWAFLDGKHVPVRLRLPFASEWKRQDVGNVLRLEHAGESCQIAIRIWSTSRIATVKQCFDELQLMDPGAQIVAPQADVTLETAVVSRDAFDPGGDFHGWLVATAHAASSTPIQGTLVGVAAGIGRCVAIVAETSSESVDGEQRVAERLAWLVEGVAKSITVRSVTQRLN